MLNDAKLGILHDHYVDSFSHIREYIGIRDRLLSLVLVLVTLMLFDMFSPQESSSLISQFVCSKIGLEAAINISFIGNILWFGMLALCLKYFQTVVYIERQYVYLEKIEGTLTSEFGKELFTREGKSYLNNYPLFSHWSHVLYTIVFPSILLSVLLIKIINETIKSGQFTWLLVCNWLMFLSIAVSIVLYLVSFHFKKKEEENNGI